MDPARLAPGPDTGYRTLRIVLRDTPQGGVPFSPSYLFFGPKTD